MRKFFLQRSLSVFGPSSTEKQEIAKTIAKIKKKTNEHDVLQHISSWMTANLLTLNSSKTEFLLIGLKQQLAKTHTFFS